MIKNLSLLIILLMCVFGVRGQDKLKLNTWHGLVLNQSTVADAKKTFKTNGKESFPVSFKPIVAADWFANKKEKKYRNITFTGVEGFDEVNLFFLDDILVVIQLDLKQDLPTTSLINTYEKTFFPLLGNHIGMTPTELDEGKRQIIYPDEGFPLEYYLASANDEAIGLAKSVIGAKMRMKHFGSENIKATTLPGSIKKIQLISRQLESKQQIDLLK